MWISRALFERLLTEKAAAEGKAIVLTQRITAMDATLDWLKVQLTKSEYERAALVQNYMGVKIPVMEIAQEKTEPAVRGITADDIMAATVSFDDVGDEEARRLGLDWDPEGRATHNGKLIQG